MALSDDEGVAMVRLARSSVDNSVKESTTPEDEEWDFPFLMDETRGVRDDRRSWTVDLRGCLGYPYPTKKLGEAVVEAAIARLGPRPSFPPGQG